MLPTNTDGVDVSSSEILRLIRLLNDPLRVPSVHYSLAHSLFILRMSINSLFCVLLSENCPASKKLLRRVDKILSEHGDYEDVWFSDIKDSIRFLHENRERFGFSKEFDDCGELKRHCGLSSP